MENFDVARNATNTAINSEGSAAKENAKYLDSIEGRIKQFNSAVQSISSTVVQGDFLKGVISFGTEAVQVLDKVISKIGIVKTILGTIAAIKIASLFKSTKDVLGNTVSASPFTKWISDIVNINSEMTGMNQKTISFSSLMKKIGGDISTAFSAHPILIAAAAIGGLIVAAQAFEDSTNQTFSESKASATEARNQYSDLTSAIDTAKQKVSENNKQIEEIKSQGNITIIEEAEIEKLTNANAELERTIALKQSLADLNLKTSAEQAKDALSESYVNQATGQDSDSFMSKMADFATDIFAYGGTNIDAASGKNQKANLNGGSKNAVTIIEETQNRIDAYKKAQDDLTTASNNLKKADASNQATLQAEYDKAVNAKASATDNLEKVQTDLQTNLNSYYDKDGKALFGYQTQIETVQKALGNIMQVTMGQKEYLSTQMQGLLDKTKYADAKKQLLELGEYGDVSVKTLTTRFPELSKEIAKTGLSLQDVVAYFNSFKTSATSVASQVLPDISDMQKNLADYQKQQESVSKAVKESNNASGMGIESALVMRGAGYGDALIRSSEGIKVDIQAYENLRKAREANYKQNYQQEITNEQIAYDKNRTKLTEYTKQLNELQKKRNEITNNGANNTGAVGMLDSQITNLSAMIDKTKSEGDIYSNHINQVKDLAAAYEGLTTDYQHWLDAQSMGENGDKYDALAKGAQDTKDKVETQGLKNTNSTRAFEQLWTKDDLTGASAKVVADHYQDAMAKASRYVTADVTDDKKNVISTAKDGINNFVSDLETYGDKYVSVGEDGSKSIQGTDEKIKEMSDDLGISASAVDALLGKVSDYGDVSVNSFEQGSALLSDMTSKAQEAAQALSESTGIDIKVNFDGESIDQQAADIESQIDQVNQLRADPQINTDQLNQANDVLAELLNKREQLDDNTTLGTIDTSGLDANVAKVISDLQQYQQAVNELNTANQLKSVGVDVDTDAAQQKVDTLKNDLSGLQDSHPEIFATLGIDTQSGTDLNTQIQNLGKPQIDATVKLDKTEVDTFQSSNTDKESKVNYAVNATSVYRWQAPDKSAQVNYYASFSNVSAPALDGVINYRTKISGQVQANGTAHGGAYARGSGWQTKRGETALTGELGQELVVNGNRWWTVGDMGAEFSYIPAGSIVFNHKQTKSLLENGYITGRGKANVNGTALASGTAFADGTDSVEHIDLMARNIDNATREFEKLSKAIKDCTTNYQEQNDLTDKALNAAFSELNSYQAAQGIYMDKANSVGLEQNWVDAIQQGYPVIYDVTDEDLKKRISEYEDWYDKAVAINDKITDLKENIKELSMQKLTNIENSFEKFIGFNASLQKVNDSVIAFIKETGNRNANEDYYKGVGGETAFINNIQQANAQRTYYKQEYEKLTAQLYALVDNGTIIKGSLDWLEWSSKITEARASLVNMDTEIVKAREALLEFRWKPFDDGIKKIENMNTHLKDFNGLIDETMEFTTNTSSLAGGGYTKIGLLQQQLTSNKRAVTDYAEAIKSLQAQYANGLYTESQYETKLEELKDGQYKYASAIKETKDALLDIIKNGIQKETDAMNDLIDARKDALQKQKDAYDWEKKVSDSTTKINKINAQIAAMSGDTTLAGTAKRKKLEADLKEQQDSLNDDRRDHQYDLMTKAYDDEADEFEKSQKKQLDILESSLDAQDSAIQSLLESTKNNYSKVYDELEKYTNEYGISLTDDITNPWKTAIDAITAYTDAVKNVADETADAFSKVDSSVVDEWGTGGGSSSSSASSTPAPATPAETPSTPAQADTGNDHGIYQVVNADEYLNIRDNPNGNIIGSASNGNWLETDNQEQDGWLHVRYSNGVLDYWGWANKGYLEPVQHAANGSRYTKSGLTLTDEQGLGSEVIVTKDGVLRQLGAGDKVFSKQQASRLWDLSNNMMLDSSIANLQNLLSRTVNRANINSPEYSGGASVNMNYESLVTVNGNVDKDALPSLEEICKKASEYTKRDMADTFNKIGMHRIIS